MSRSGFSEAQWLLALRIGFYLYAGAAVAYVLAGVASTLRAREQKIPWILLLINPFLCMFFSIFIAWGLSDQDPTPAWIGGLFATIFVVLPALATLGSALLPHSKGSPGKKGTKKNNIPKWLGVVIVPLFQAGFAAAVLYGMFGNRWVAAIGFVVMGGVGLFKALKYKPNASRSSSSAEFGSSGSSSSSSYSSSSSSSSGGGSSGGGGSSSDW